MINWTVNQPMLDRAEQFHSQAMDQFVAPGIDMFTISGCQQNTVTQILRQKKKNGEDEYRLRYSDGDGTVPLGSAEAIGVSLNNRFYSKKAVHGEMPSHDGIRQLIVQMITGKIVTSSLPQNITQDKIVCKIKGKVVSVYSPVDIHVYDEIGNHVGVTTTGTLDQNIEGVRMDVVGTDKFVFLPTDGHEYQVRLDATATGTFSLRVENVVEGVVTSSVYYADVPIVPTSEARFIVSVTSADDHVEFDQTGTGVFQPLLADTILDVSASQDMLSTSTTLGISGTHGAADWFRSDVIVSVSTTDDISGVLKTEYSLDEGGTWLLYHQPLSIRENGNHPFWYASVDRAGNREEVQKIIIHIDATPPEVVFSFDRRLKDIIVSGFDAMGTTTVYQNSSSTVVIDEAGNTAEVSMQKIFTPYTVRAQIPFIVYNNRQPVRLPRHLF